MIENLPLLTPDPARTTRTLSRCRERIARRHAKPYLVERALVTGIGLIYLMAMAGDLAGLYRSF
jgi:hypothetical protein